MEEHLTLPISSWQRLPWSPDINPQQAFDELREHLQHQPIGIAAETNEQVLERTLEFVFYSNKAEGIEQEYGATRKMLQDAMAGGGQAAIEEEQLTQRKQVAKPNEDHGRNLRFVVQHYMALLKVQSMTPSDWTVDNINGIHHTLLEGLEDAEAGTTVTPGQLRTEPCCTTGIASRQVQYMDHEQVPKEYSKLIALVRSQLEETVPHDLQRGIALAGFFLVEFLRIHPYGDGNGRMARLLTNAILKQYGIPCPLVLVRGQLRKARRHYLQMLDRIQHRQNPITLAFTFILVHALDDARRLAETAQGTESS